MRRVRLEEALGTVEAVRGTVAEVLWDTGARCAVPLAWLSDAPGCADCGGEIEAERSSRKYCSDPCRQRAFRRNAKRPPAQDTGEPENGCETRLRGLREAAAA